MSTSSLDKKEWISLDFEWLLMISTDERFCLLWNHDTEAVENLMCSICAFECECDAFDNFSLY